MRHSVSSTARVALVASALALALGGGSFAAASTASTAASPGRSLGDVTRLVQGDEGYCALVKSGGVECWGDNSYGELGAGLKVGSSNVPVALR